MDWGLFFWPRPSEETYSLSHICDVLVLQPFRFSLVFPGFIRNGRFRALPSWNSDPVLPQEFSS